MTFQTAQIQAIIAEIDEALSQTSGFGLGWLTSRETGQQRRVLERVRDNLQILQQQLASVATDQARTEPNRLAAEMTAVGEETRSPQEANRFPALQQHWQAELETLRQQREALLQEIQQLEQQRQNYLPPEKQPSNQERIIAEFFQALTSSLQESLTPQLTQTLSHLEAEFSGYQSTNVVPLRRDSFSASPDTTETETASPLNSQEYTEELQQQQARMARLLKTLDSKLSLMFETLQRNLHKYRSSFSQGLEKMHRLSEESEAMLKELVDRLQESEEEISSSQPALSKQLSQESTTVTKAGTETPIILPSVLKSPEETPFPSRQSNPASNVAFPYAGIEWVQPPAQPTSQSIPTGVEGAAVAPIAENTEVGQLNLEPEGSEIDFGESISQESSPEARLYQDFAALAAQQQGKTLRSQPERSPVEPTPSLEELLLAEDYPASPTTDEEVATDEINLLSDEMANLDLLPVPATSDTSDIEDLEIADTIENLTDLLDDTAFSQDRSPPKPSFTADNTAISQNQSSSTLSVTPVVQEEDLLPINEAQEQSEMDLGLGTNALQQLREDLSSLEPGVPQLDEEPELTLPQESKADWSSEPIPPAGQDNFRFGETVGEEESDSGIPDEILTEFDELFGDLTQEPTAESASDSSADLTEPRVAQSEPPAEPEKKN